MTVTHWKSRWLLFDPLSRLGTSLISFFALTKESSGGGGGGTGGGSGGGTGGHGPGGATSASPTSVGSEPVVPRCCGLANPGTVCPHPQGRAEEFTCPEGFYRSWWTCCEGSKLAFCGECGGLDREGKPSCYDGPFPCSIGWITNERC
jgi:hypothetical protein